MVSNLRIGDLDFKGKGDIINGFLYYSFNYYVSNIHNYHQFKKFTGLVTVKYNNEYLDDISFDIEASEIKLSTEGNGRIEIKIP